MTKTRATMTNREISQRVELLEDLSADLVTLLHMVIGACVIDDDVFPRIAKHLVAAGEKLDKMGIDVVYGIVESGDGAVN